MFINRNRNILDLGLRSWGTGETLERVLEESMTVYVVEKPTDISDRVGGGEVPGSRI